MTRRLLFFLFVSSFSCVIAWANPEDEYTRIARLSYIEGNVSFEHASDADWSAASINLPLQPGDRIYTGLDGRVEIEFDDSSILRLAEKTDVEILSLKERIIQIRFITGLGTLTVSSSLDFEVNTPAAAFNTQRKGIYRFNVQENGDSDAIVRRGELEAANNIFSRSVVTGEMLHISPRDTVANEITPFNLRDAWDEWNDRRNADIKSYASRRYLPENVYAGASDLDRYGRWIVVEPYGNAWVPFSVGADWSPYSVGRWVYRPVWGWTWVSYEPWGWLPYHYGRWHFSLDRGWCWLPGPAFSFNFWSPGLVSFYSGPGWISWCPLGPGDYYNINNYYFNRGLHHRFLNQLRALHFRDPGDPFNRNSRRAFHTIGREHFINGNSRSSMRPGSGRIEVSQPWRQGTIVRDRLPIQPTSRSFSPAPEHAIVRPREASALPAIVRTDPGSNISRAAQYKRITNPEIHLHSPIHSPDRNNNSPESNSNIGGGRTFQAPPPERGNTRTESMGDRRINVPPPSGGDGRNMSREREKSNQPDRQNAPNPPRYERPAPESRPAPTPSNERPAPEQRTAPAPRYERPAPESRPAPTPSNERPAPEQRTAPAPRYERPAPESRPAPTPSNERPAPEQRTAPAPRYERPAPESRPAPAPSNERPAPEQRTAPAPRYERPAPESRPAPTPSNERPAPEQRTAPAPRYERPAPESRPAPAPSNDRPAPEQRTAPREYNQASRPSSDSRPRDYSSSFRSDSGGAWTRTENRSMQTPEIGRSRIDSAPRQSFPSISGDRNGAGHANPAPYSGRINGAAARADGNRQSAPRQDSQNGGARGRR